MEEERGREVTVGADRRSGCDREGAGEGGRAGVCAKRRCEARALIVL